MLARELGLPVHRLMAEMPAGELEQWKILFAIEAEEDQKD